VRRDSTVQMRLTDHAELRMAERAQLTGKAASDWATWLWSRGRKPKIDEFAKFGTYPRADRRYRVVMWRGMWWLMVSDRELNKVVTIIDERN
jgi:hypothetical protein